jgi:hypothetical protein
MRLNIIQNETDKTDWLKKVVNFLSLQVKTQEQLENRFDILLVSFAMENNGVYNPETNELVMLGGHFPVPFAEDK